MPLEGDGRVNSVAFSPDGNLVVSGSTLGAIQLWDVQTRKPALDSFKGSTSGVSSVKFSHDGTKVVSSSWDEMIRV